MKKFKAPSRVHFPDRAVYRVPLVDSVEAIMQDFVVALDEVAVPHFGVINRGVFFRECYSVDFNLSDWETQPVSKCVMLLKRDAESVSTMADVVERFWRISSERVNRLSLIDGWDCRRVPVEYAFEDPHEAREWLNLNPVPPTSFTCSSLSNSRVRQGSSFASWTRRLFDLGDTY